MQGEPIGQEPAIVECSRFLAGAEGGIPRYDRQGWRDGVPGEWEHRRG